MENKLSRERKYFLIQFIAHSYWTLKILVNFVENYNLLIEKLPIIKAISRKIKLKYLWWFQFFRNILTIEKKKSHQLEKKNSVIMIIIVRDKKNRTQTSMFIPNLNVSYVKIDATSRCSGTQCTKTVITCIVRVNKHCNTMLCAIFFRAYIV